MMLKAPELDSRKAEEILGKIRELAPFYCPGWSAEPDRGPGAALARIFAAMLEGVLTRLNGVPDKNLVAFLDRMGVKLVPPQPARVPVTFLLSQGARENVLVPARTQAAAAEIVFETEQAFVATPAKLAKMYSFKNDAIYDTPLDRRFELFAGASKQLHALYLGAGTLFNVNGVVTLETDLPGTLANNAKLQWEYGTTDERGAEKWVALLAGTSADGRLRLDKTQEGEIAELEKHGIKSRWIRCISLEAPAVDWLEIQPVSFSQKSSPCKSPVPELLYYNNVPLDTKMTRESTVYPFGGHPRPQDCFYIASKEVFSKEGAEITLEFATVEPSVETKPEATAQLSFEYWDGNGWTILKAAGAAATLPKSLKVDNWPRLQPYKVNGKENYWIRIRLVDGHYGQDVYLQGTTLVSGKVVPPQITRVSVAYRVEGQQPDHYLIENNLDWINVTQAVASPVPPAAFRVMERETALYLGFLAQPQKGPLSIFFDVEETRSTPQSPPIEWQYLTQAEGRDAWKRLEALDATYSFSRAGTVQFAFPSEIAKTRRFGSELYWIRAAGISAAATVAMKGVYPNTTWAVQAVTVRDETLGSSDGSADQAFKLSKFPAFSCEVWVNEITALADAERKRLQATPGIGVKEVPDDKGEIQELWVRWSAVEDLAGSGAGDRHYELDDCAGVVLFGNGIAGKVPPIGKDNVRASFRTGGGSAGNVGASSVTTLKSSVPFVDKVCNPVAAGGGTDTEAIEAAMDRGVHLLRNNLRGVTAEDYEYLARQAAPGIARVKCIPNVELEVPGRKVTRASGKVSVVILPATNEARPFPSLQLISRVEEFLKPRISCAVAAKQAALFVTGPCYVEVSVVASLAVCSMEYLPLVENEAQIRISRFLHPLIGGDAQRGWEFGRLPYLSDFFAILENIEWVDHVERLSATLTPGKGKGEAIVLTPGQADLVALLPQELVCSGSHRIEVTFYKGGN